MASLLFPAVAQAASPTLIQSAPLNIRECQQTAATNNHVGMTLEPYNFTTFRGIRSEISQTSDTQFCSSLIDITRGPSYWVALTPGPGNTHYNAFLGSAIMQIGVIRCHNPLYDVCQNGAPRLFYALGGCNQALPTPRDLGPAPSGPITFAARYEGLSRYWLSAANAGGTLASIHLASDQPEIICWASGTAGPVQGDLYCEKQDTGDSCGPSYSDFLYFNKVRYQKSLDGAWRVPGMDLPALFDADCYSRYPSVDHCNAIDEDSFSVWTTH